MIHPCLATMLAVVTTDYPLAAGEAHGVPQARRRRELQPDLGRRRVLDERRRDPARERRERVERTAATDREFAAALERGLRRPVPADRRWTARVRPSCSRSRSPAPRARARRTRSRSGSPPRRSSRPRRSAATRTGAAILAAAGSAFVSGGFAQVDVDRLTLRMNGVAVFAEGEPTGAEVSLDGAGLPDRARPRARHGRCVLPRLRPHVRLREDQRGVHDVIVVKVGGAVRRLRSRGTPTTPSSSTAAARRSRRRWRPRAWRSPSSAGAGSRAPPRSRSSAPRSSTVNAQLCAAIGPRAVGLAGDEIGLRATRVPGLGHVGTPVPSRPQAVARRARRRADPRRRAARRRTAERQRRRGRGRARDRARRRCGSCS